MYRQVRVAADVQLLRTRRFVQHELEHIGPVVVASKAQSVAQSSGEMSNVKRSVTCGTS